VFLIGRKENLLGDDFSLSFQILFFEKPQSLGGPRNSAFINTYKSQITREQILVKVLSANFIVLIFDREVI
jgi:hypothetical protein